MIRKRDTINPGKTVFDNNNQEGKCGPVWDKSVPDLWLSFCPSFLFVRLTISGCFWRIKTSKKCDETVFRVKLLCSAAGYILLSPNL